MQGGEPPISGSIFRNPVLDVVLGAVEGPGWRTVGGGRGQA